MIVTLLILSVLFVGIGFLITEKNAPYLLAGYNTLSKEEQAKWDLKSYLIFFRRVHLVLGVSLLFVGFFLHFTFPGDAVVYWLVFYPLMFYGYVLWASQKFHPEDKKMTLKTYIGLGVLLLTIVGVAGGLYYAHRPNTIQINKEQIEISGAYGATFIRNKTTVTVVDSLPKITLRINGIGTKQLRKGYFRTSQKKKVKLLLDGQQGPFLLFEQKGASPLYYQVQGESHSHVMRLLTEKGWLSRP